MPRASFPAAIEKSLIADATGSRDRSGNVQLYLTGVGRILHWIGAQIGGMGGLVKQRVGGAQPRNSKVDQELGLYANTAVQTIIAL